VHYLFEPFAKAGERLPYDLIDTPRARAAAHYEQASRWNVGCAPDKPGPDGITGYKGAVCTKRLSISGEGDASGGRELPE
jgi:hypothetical protein